MKSVYLILMLIISHGCSYGLVTSTNTKYKKCTTNYGAPLLDTGFTVLGTVSTVGLGYVVFLISALSTKPVSNSAYLVVGASAVGTIYAGNSMVYGYEEVSNCRRKNERLNEKRDSKSIKHKSFNK